MSDLKLYVWEGLFNDGIMFALAESVDSARQLIREQSRYGDGSISPYVEEGLKKEPQVVVAPRAFLVWAGA